MDCKTIESLLQGYLDGEVSKEEKDSVLLHLKGCPSCQKEVEWSERVREHFQVERELPPGFRADLYVRMDSAGSPSRVRLLWAGGLAVLLLLLSIPFVNRTVFFPSDGTPRIHVVSPLEDEVLSGEGMDICAAFYPAIEKRSGI